jgi:hypothetical protein
MVLKWKHEKSISEAKLLMQQKLQQRGYGNKVKWNGDSFSASVAFGAVLRIEGKITDQELVLDQCSGAVSGTVLNEIRNILQQLFPEGQIM